MPAIALPGMNMPRTVCKSARALPAGCPRNIEETLKRKHSLVRNFHFAGRSTVHAQNAMVATSHPEAALTAIDVMRRAARRRMPQSRPARCSASSSRSPTGIGGDFALR
jgi:hypothetical protein